MSFFTFSADLPHQLAAVNEGVRHARDAREEPPDAKDRPAPG